MRAAVQLRAFCLAPGWDPAPVPAAGREPRRDVRCRASCRAAREGFSPAGRCRSGGRARAAPPPRLGPGRLGGDGTGSRSPLTRATTLPPRVSLVAVAAAAARFSLTPRGGRSASSLVPWAPLPSPCSCPSWPVRRFQTERSFRYDEPQSAGNRWAKFGVNCSLFPEPELMVGLLRFCDTAAFALSKARGNSAELI